MDILETLKQLGNWVYEAPAVLLIIVALNALGFVLKSSPFVPNTWIRGILCVVGITLTLLLAPIPQGRNPYVMLGVFGFIFAVVAMFAHATLLKRAEKFFPGLFGEKPEDTNNAA